MKKLVIISLISMLGAASAFAKPYGSAGCGLGSVLMGNNGNQVLAATTNGSTYTQFFGISSGTSNCTDASKMASVRQVPYFVEANRVALAGDIARGGGDTINSLSAMMGCKDSATLGAQLQGSYGTIFPNEKVGSDSVSDSILNVVKKTPALSANCGNV